MAEPEGIDRRRTLIDGLSDRARLALMPVARGSEAIPAADLAAIVAQYELYVEMADRISARRQTANNFFLTISSALVSVGGFSVARGTIPVPLKYVWASAIAGVFVSLLWWRLITSYRDLNTAKFKVVHEIETLLPVKPYRAEWSEVGGGKVSKLYLPVTHAERVVPIGFGLLHCVLAVAVTAARTVA